MLINKTDLFQAQNVLDPDLFRGARDVRVSETDLKLVRRFRVWCDRFAAINNKILSFCLVSNRLRLTKCDLGLVFETFHSEN